MKLKIEKYYIYELDTYGLDGVIIERIINNNTIKFGYIYNYNHPSRTIKFKGIHHTEDVNTLVNDIQSDIKKLASLYYDLCTLGVIPKI